MGELSGSKTAPVLANWMLRNSQPMALGLVARLPLLRARHFIDERGRPLLVNQKSLARIATRHLPLAHFAICKHEFKQPSRKAPTCRALGSGVRCGEQMAFEFSRVSLAMFGNLRDSFALRNL